MNVYTIIEKKQKNINCYDSNVKPIKIQINNTTQTECKNTINQKSQTNVKTREISTQTDIIPFSYYDFIKNIITNNFKYISFCTIGILVGFSSLM